MSAAIIVKQPSEHLPAVSLIPIPVGSLTGTGTTTVLGITFKTDTNASGYYNYQIKQSVPNFGSDGVIVNNNPEICTLTGDTLMRIVNGTAMATVEKNGYKIPINVSFSSTSSSDSVWTGFTGTTTSSTQSDPLLNLLVGGKETKYYSATWPLSSAPSSAVNFSRNPNCWASGIDFTASAIATGLGENVNAYNSGGLISPQHGIGVKHFGQGVENMGPGQKLFYADASGNVYERTVVQRYIHPSKDLIVWRLDAALPASIKPFKLPSISLYDTANNRLFGMGWQINQKKQIGIIGFDKFTQFPQDFDGVNLAWDNEFLKKTDPVHRLYGKDTFIMKGVTGDSGGAVGGVFNGESFLVSLFTGSGSGMYYSSVIAPELNNIIASLDAAQGVATGYQVGVLEIVATFDPLTLSPSLWLDASDTNTLYDATSGGSLVAPDGGVARWEDKSANARHATQATAGLRPLRKAATLNGKSVLRFDGVDDVLAHSLGVVGDNTVFMVVKSTAAGGGTRILFSATSPNDPLNAYLREDNASNWGVYRISGLKSSGQSVIGAYKIISTQSVGANGSFTQNGTLIPFTDTGFYSDANLRRGIGGNGFGAENFNGDIAEILVFPTALSTTDRAKVESYLNAKWAVY